MARRSWVVSMQNHTVAAPAVSIKTMGGKFSGLELQNQSKDSTMACGVIGEEVRKPRRL